MIPKGTTPEQWERYNEELQIHEMAMNYKELYFNFVCEMLKSNIAKWPEEWKNSPALMAESFHKNMTAELNMSKSCDAPNKPGYAIANND